MDARPHEASRGTRRHEVTRDASTVNVVTDGADSGMRRRKMSFSGGGGTFRAKCQADAIPLPRSSRREDPTRKSVSRHGLHTIKPGDCLRGDRDVQIEGEQIGAPQRRLKCSVAIAS